MKENNKTNKEVNEKWLIFLDKSEDGNNKWKKRRILLFDLLFISALVLLLYYLPYIYYFVSFNKSLKIFYLWYYFHLATIL